MKRKIVILISIMLLLAAWACAEDGRVMDTYAEFTQVHPGLQPKYDRVDGVSIEYTQQNGVAVQADFELIVDEMLLTYVRIPFSGTVDEFVPAPDPACVADIVVGSTAREQILSMPGVYHTVEHDMPDLDLFYGSCFIYEDGLCWSVGWDTYGGQQLADSVILRVIMPSAAEALGMRGSENLNAFDDVVILTSTLEEVAAAHPDYQLREHGNCSYLRYYLDDFSVLMYAFEVRDGEMLLTAATYAQYRDIFNMDNTIYGNVDEVRTGRKDPDDFSMVYVGKTTFNELGAEYRQHMQMETGQKMFYLKDTRGNTLHMFFIEGPGYGIVAQAYDYYSTARFASSKYVNAYVDGDELNALVEYLEANDIGY